MEIYKVCSTLLAVALASSGCEQTKPPTDVTAAPAALGQPSSAQPDDLSALYRLIERVELEYGATSIPPVTLAFRKNEAAAPIPYSILNSYDLLFVQDNRPALFVPSLRPIVEFLNGTPSNNWDSLTYLSNFPINDSLQPVARQAFASARSNAVRVGLTLAFRHSTLTRETTQLLAQQLLAADANLRTSALIALQPANALIARRPQSNFDVEAILSALNGQTSMAFRLEDSPLVFAMLADDAFVRSPLASQIVDRLRGVGSHDALQAELIAYYKAKIGSAVGSGFPDEPSGSRTSSEIDRFTGDAVPRDRSEWQAFVRALPPDAEAAARITNQAYSDKGISFSYWIARGTARSDLVGLIVLDGPCGRTASIQASTIPPSDSRLESDEVFEVDAGGRQLRKWRVPVDQTPEGVNGDELLLRLDVEGREDLFLAVKPDGRYRVVPFPGAQSKLQPAACPSQRVLTGSAYVRCVLAHDDISPNERRYLVYEAPCS